eukprot:TRINITY_DN764_c0_g2_i2.p2 TRINITY_DN764_c0_g2~~TRINITY_DN764_c0_g2_i2.p2  ORF type:complete len:129 (-),score=2.34 TRINITY_DN764_c0_g2_i2:174-560(-)
MIFIYCQKLYILMMKGGREKSSGVTQDRTRDLQIFSLTLSQLSYHPWGKFFFFFFFWGELREMNSGPRAPEARIIPLDQAPYEYNLQAVPRFELGLSNQGPLDLQSNALPTELSPLGQVRIELTTSGL